MSYLIADQSTGIQRDLRPWLLPEQAYTELENAYIFRGRTPKKMGALSLGPLSTIPAAAYPVLAVGALVAGVNTFTVSALIAGMNGIVPKSLFMTFLPGGEMAIDNGNGSMSISGTNPVQISVTYATTVVSITVPVGSPLIGSSVSVTSVHTFPTVRTPCMGISYRQLPSINFEQTIFFDQIRSYIRSAGGFQIIDPLGVSSTWTGTDSDFFWSTNVRNPLAGNTSALNENFFYATNFNLADPIRYLDNTDTWTDFEPLIFPANRLYQARCIVQFKNRLLFFNTWEGTTRVGAENYPNRLRFSWIGDPTDQVNGYIQSPAGKGGFIDAGIAQQITSIAVLKDCVLVKFETVSWRVVYTGNPYQPFEWQKINQEFGSDSTFSSVQFDDFVLTVGNRAITQDSSIGVTRIDEKIPDEVFEISNFNDGVKRVHGERDFNQELVYWTIPYPTSDNPGVTLRYPNRMLCYSYRTAAFSFFRDSYTALGRFQNQTFFTWADYPYTWDTAPDTWGGAGSEFGFENLAAGNQQGNIFLLQKKVENDPAYEITSITVDPAGNPTVTIADHNLDNDDFVLFTNVVGFESTAVPQVFVLNQGDTDLVETGLPTTGSFVATGVLPGQIDPGSMVVTLTQTLPPLTVTFYDQGNGSLLSTNPLFTGQVSYDEQAISLQFPAVPGAGNVTTVTVNYNYSNLNGRIFAVTNRTANTFGLGLVDANDQIDPFVLPLGLPAFEFGQVAYLTNFLIGTKQFNPFIKDDKTINMPYADLYIDGTQEGVISMEIYTDDHLTASNIPLYTQSGAQFSISTIRETQRFWTRVFTNARGEFIQLYFFLSNIEMMEGKSFNPFVLHGLMPKFEQSGRLIRTRY